MCRIQFVRFGAQFRGYSGYGEDVGWFERSCQHDALTVVYTDHDTGFSTRETVGQMMREIRDQSELIFDLFLSVGALSIFSTHLQ